MRGPPDAAGGVRREGREEEHPDGQRNLRLAQPEDDRRNGPEIAHGPTVGPLLSEAVDVMRARRAGSRVV
ncbi:hypothetical protein NLS1_16730 [Nocardioides sp. LS1]|nr:hypothetical protein NLS1_16730 [Nocardioides sp. LS1]